MWPQVSALDHETLNINCILPPPPKADKGNVFTPVCLFLSRICQKGMDGFGRNLVDRLGV